MEKIEKKKLILNDSLERRNSVDISTAYNSGHPEQELSRWEMRGLVFEIAGPAIVSQLIMYLQEVMNTIFGGHLNDPDVLAAIGLANITQNMLLVDVIQPLNIAIVTLASQAVGANNMELCGIYLNRQRVVSLIATVPKVLCLLHVHKVLLMAGQCPKVVAYMHTYITAYIPALVVFLMVDLQTRFLNSVGKQKYPMIAYLIGMTLNPLWIYIFTSHYQLGVAAFGCAGFVTNTLILSILLFQTATDSQLQPAVKWPDSSSFYGLYQHLALGVPSVIMTILDWWSTEISIFIAGRFGVID